jgi:hypothetical protein
LAKEVFVIWLAAAKDCSAIKEIPLWGLEDIRYPGLASHNLTRNIKWSRRDEREPQRIKRPEKLGILRGIRIVDAY